MGRAETDGPVRPGCRSCGVGSRRWGGVISRMPTSTPRRSAQRASSPPTSRSPCGCSWTWSRPPSAPAATPRQPPMSPPCATPASPRSRPGWPCWPQGQRRSPRPTATALGLFEEALAIPGVDHFPFDLARVQFLYGERLRRARSTKESRPHLAAALEIFERLGARPWASRAAGELEEPAKPTPAPISENATRSRRRNARSRCWPPAARPTRRSANSFSCHIGRSEPTCTRSFPNSA